MLGTIKRRLPGLQKAANIAVAFVMAMGLAIPSALLPGGEAHAAGRGSGIPSSAWYNNGHRVHYGGKKSEGKGVDTHTFNFDFNGDGDLREKGYCLEPAKDWIGDAQTVSPKTLKSAGIPEDNIEELAMVLYYSYGGPGFDKDMFAQASAKYYNGDNWEDVQDGTQTDAAAWYDNYYATCHVLLTSVAGLVSKENTFKGNYGDECTDKYKKWFAWNIIGKKSWVEKFTDKTEKNPNSLYYLMKADWDTLSDSLKTAYKNSCYGVYTDASTQTFAIASTYQPPYGDISLQKTSANSGITDSNGCYSLENALYGVFDSEAKAATHDAGQAIAAYSTDASGYWKTNGDIEAGTYYVAECSPSKGYQLDQGVYVVTVKAGKTAKVNGNAGVNEMPADDPIKILLEKYDKNLGNATQGGSSRANAEFTVKYFDSTDMSASDALSATAKRTWVLKTNGQGIVDLENAASQKVSGDDFYYNASERTVMPLGTVSIVETKAPQGYNLETPDGNPKTYVLRISMENGAVKATPLNYSGSHVIPESNTPIVEDTPKRGDFRLVKSVVANLPEDASMPQELGLTLAKGVQFQIINDNDGPVKSPTNGTSDVAKGGVVCTITVDENGLASTKGGASVNGWNKPSGWTGALAYGTYVVHEVIPESVQSAYQQKYGKKMLAVDDWKINITGEGQYDAPMLVTDKISQTPLKVVKIDAETGKQIPLPVSFQLKDSSGKLVKYTSHYPETETVDTFTANERGELTLPMMLEGGTYTLVEVAAPQGYALNPEGVTFKVEDVYNSWDNPLTVTFEDAPVKGKIELEKHDADTNAAVSGAQYVVAAAEDITTPDGTVRLANGETAAVVTTGEDGKASTGELYLGSYKVYEAKSPEGYALDTAEHIVALSADGQDAAVVTVGKDLYDHPSKIKVVKTDAESGKPLSGAKFRVWNDGEGDVSEIDFSALTSGLATGLKADSAAIEDFDTFKANLSSAAAGTPVKFSAKTLNATVSKQVDLIAAKGQDNSVKVVYENEAEAALYGDVLEVPAKVLPGDASNDQEIVTDDKGIAELGYLKHGKYHIVETEAPQGYYIPGSPEQVDFEVDDQGLVGNGEAAYDATFAYSAENSPNEIRTHAKANGEEVTQVSDRIEIVDAVSYKGTVPGKEYKVTGVLHVGTPNGDGTYKDEGEAKDPAGNAISAEATFTAEAQEGTVDVVFAFDGTKLAGTHLVAFEKMLDADGKLFAAHEDINDPDQSVLIAPDAKTVLVDASTGNHTARVAGKTKLVDTIEYRGLTPGEEYTAIGVLMDKDARQPLKNPDGSQVSAEAKFKPKEADGRTEVAFELDASALAGKSAVAFETIMLGNDEVAHHADYGDADQTVVFPTAKTSAADGKDGDKAILPDGKARVVDTVVYTGLTPGQQYTAYGELHLVNVDSNGAKSDGGTIKDAKGNPVAAEATFTPEAADGQTEVVFEFDATGMDGAGAVAFEAIKQTGVNAATGGGQEPVTVVTHEDPNDADQSVRITKDAPTVSNGNGKSNPQNGTNGSTKPSGSPFGQTGDLLMRYWWAVALIAVCAASAGIYGIHQRKLAMADKTAEEGAGPDKADAEAETEG